MAGFSKLADELRFVTGRGAETIFVINAKSVANIFKHNYTFNFNWVGQSGGT